MNRRNPSLKLPIHEPAGEWLVVYDVKNVAVGGRAKRIGTGLNPRDNTTSLLVESVDEGRQPHECLTSRPWKAAMDTPRFAGETDADYYQRMDELHFGRQE